METCRAANFAKKRAPLGFWAKEKSVKPALGRQPSPGHTYKALGVFGKKRNVYV